MSGEEQYLAHMKNKATSEKEYLWHDGSLRDKPEKMTSEKFDLSEKKNAYTFNEIVLLVRELDEKIRRRQGNNEIVVSIGILNLEERTWEHFNPYAINLNPHRTRGFDKENIRIRELLTILAGSQLTKDNSQSSRGDDGDSMPKASISRIAPSCKPQPPTDALTGKEKTK